VKQAFRGEMTSLENIHKSVFQGVEWSGGGISWNHHQEPPIVALVARLGRLMVKKVRPMNMAPGKVTRIPIWGGVTINLMQCYSLITVLHGSLEWSRQENGRRTARRCDSNGRGCYPSPPRCP
jgi:hypothetical protein